MGSTTCTVNGWRNRVLKQWYPTTGAWNDAGVNDVVNVVASCPTSESGGASDNMFTVIIKVTTPNSPSIGLINSITISFSTFDMNNTTGYLYGSLRTVDDSYSSISDTVDTYRTYIAGGSSEQSCSPDSYPYKDNTYSLTFNGIFEKNTSYYLWLYTKSINDIYQFDKIASPYTASCEYSNSCTIKFSAGDGSGIVPASITGYEGEYITIGNEIPTPPDNSDTINTTFDIETYNGNVLFGTHKATKSTYTKYSFANWQGGGWTVNAGGGMTITGDITLVAQYTGKIETVYSNNTLADVKSTVGIPIKSSVISNIPIILDANTNGGTTSITKLNAVKTTSYIFDGWNTSVNAFEVISDTDRFTSATSLYAIYKSIDSTAAVALPTTGVSKASENISEYTITLNPGEGSVTPTTVTANKIRSYTFKGWGTSATATSYITSYTPTENNQTIYAIFDNGTEVDQPAVLPTPVRTNYAFLGWSTTNGGIPYVNTTYMPSSNITLYANYKASNAIEMYIYTSGGWKRAKGHLCTRGVLYNECVDDA